MTGSVYVIGDIHGEAALLDRLLSQIEPLLTPTDHVVFLGDYIDRGPDSRGVVDRILALRAAAPCPVICLLGNHEEWMLDAMADPTRSSWLAGMQGASTIASYDESVARLLTEALRRRGLDRSPLPYEAFFEETLPAEHRRFFETLPHYWTTERLLCVHAGVDPQIETLEQQDPRLFCWANTALMVTDWRGPRTLVVGHTRTDELPGGQLGEPLILPHLVALDTGACWTGVLTAVRFPDRAVFRGTR